MRTNNQVERTNRVFRFLEKARYEWRRRRAPARFVELKLDDVWRERLPGGGSVASSSSRSCPGDSQQSDEAA